MKLTFFSLILLFQVILILIKSQECYIGNCGCPGNFKEDWCNESQSKFESTWCNSSEKNCGQCKGTWCEEKPQTEGICYIDVCGCPDNWLSDWCSLSEAKFDSTWCQKNSFRCDECGGFWCAGEQLIEKQNNNNNQDNNQDNDQDNQDNDQDNNNNDQDNNVEGEDGKEEDVDGDSGRCYIDVCGCPSDFFNVWCEVESAQFLSAWCQSSAGQCDECKGYWCAGDDLVEDDKEQDDFCFISECGCPGNFQQDWCDATNQLPGGYCQDSEGNCQDCSGVWCPGGDQNEGDLDEDDEDNQTVGGKIHIFYTGLAFILVALSF